MPRSSVWKYAKFQSTHPRRVRRLSASIRETDSSFNPRTHVGCDVRKYFSMNVFISFNPRTHVGCDLCGINPVDLLHLFQSTHPRRVRRLWGLRLVQCIGFNPRTHVGCDNDRATMASGINGFNPRTHVGCDYRRVSLSYTIDVFQSTHPRRVRPNTAKTNADTATFQSTHPRRVRPC